MNRSKLFDALSSKLIMPDGKLINQSPLRIAKVRVSSCQVSVLWLLVGLLPRDLLGLLLGNLLRLLLGTWLVLGYYHADCTQLLLPRMQVHC